MGMLLCVFALCFHTIRFYQISHTRPWNNSTQFETVHFALCCHTTWFWSKPSNIFFAFDILFWSSFVEPSADISGGTMLQADHMYDCYAINKGTELTVHSRLNVRVAGTSPKPSFHLRFYAACDLVSTRNGETINSGDKCYNPLTGWTLRILMKSGDERTGALCPLASPADPESPSFCYKLPKRSVTTLRTRPLLNIWRPFKERPSRGTRFAFLISFAGSGWLCCSQRPSYESFFTFSQTIPQHILM